MGQTGVVAPVSVNGMLNVVLPIFVFPTHHTVRFTVESLLSSTSNGMSSSWRAVGELFFMTCIVHVTGDSATDVFVAHALLRIRRRTERCLSGVDVLLNRLAT